MTLRNVHLLQGEFVGIRCGIDRGAPRGPPDWRSATNLATSSTDPGGTWPSADMTCCASRIDRRSWSSVIRAPSGIISRTRSAGSGPHPPQTLLHGSHETLGSVRMVLQPAVLGEETHRREEFRTEHLTRPRRRARVRNESCGAVSILECRDRAGDEDCRVHLLVLERGDGTARHAHSDTALTSSGSRPLVTSR